MVLLAGMACQARGSPAATGTEPIRRSIVYGTDDRRELFAHPDPAWRERGRRSTVALVRPAAFDFTGAPVVRLRAAPLSAYDDFCSSVRFLDQPTAAECSGTLIDDDLVMTAAHCFELLPDCRDLAVVTDYRYDGPGQLAPLGRENIFGCRRLALRTQSAPDSAEQIDVAVIQLDRPVDGAHGPVPLRPPGPVAAGEAMVVIGSPERLPSKIDSGATVLDPRPATGDYFTLLADAFTGSSGSGVLDAAGRLTGALVRGGSDYEDRRGCRVARIAPPGAAGESATYARRAVADLCASGWTSVALCGAPPVCGDGVCASPENPAGCPADCAAPSCGDKLCERPEWESCPQDCGDRRRPGLPAGWWCEEQWYGDGETCDCACGAPDPDCGPADNPRACDKSGPAGREVPPSGGGCAVGGRGAGGGGWGWVVGLAVVVLIGRRRARMTDQRA